MGRSPNAAKRMDARELPAGADSPVGLKLPEGDMTHQPPPEGHHVLTRAPDSSFPCKTFFLAVER